MSKFEIELVCYRKPSSFTRTVEAVDEDAAIELVKTMLVSSGAALEDLEIEVYAEELDEDA